jgi:hypothetical protein
VARMRMMKADHGALAVLLAGCLVGCQVSVGGKPENGVDGSVTTTGGTGGPTDTGGNGAGGSGSGGNASGGSGAGGSGTGGSGSGGSGAAGQSGAGGSSNNSQWANAMGDLYPQAMGGGDLITISPQPGSKRVIVDVGSGKGLFASDDGGKSWKPLGTGAGSAKINNNALAIVFDPNDANVFWESGSYGDGVFKTTDGGVTFTRLGDISHLDIVSVDFTDPARKTLLAGTHEQRRKLYLSRDGGTTWMDIGSKLPGEGGYASAALVINTQTFLLGTDGGGGAGVFRSTDGGNGWTRVAPEGVYGRPLYTSKGAIYWPVTGENGLIISTDQGQTWKRSGKGPVQNYTGSPVELPDGRIMALGKPSLQVSSDGGATWKSIGPPLPYPGANCGIYGFGHSPESKALFVNHNDCSGKVLKDSLFTTDFDYTKQ